MRKKWIYYLSVVSAIGLVFWACQHDRFETDYEGPEPTITVEDARAFFEQQMTTKAGGHNPWLACDDGQPYGFSPGDFAPQWKKAKRAVATHYLEGVDVEIIPTYYYQANFYQRHSNGKMSRQSVPVTQRLIVNQWENHQTWNGMYSYILTVIPTPEYYSKNKDVDRKFRNFGNKRGFSGYTVYYTLDGKFVGLNKYQEGKVAAEVYDSDGSGMDLEAVNELMDDVGFEVSTMSSSVENCPYHLIFNYNCPSCQAWAEGGGAAIVRACSICKRKLEEGESCWTCCQKCRKNPCDCPKVCSGCGYYVSGCMCEVGGGNNHGPSDPGNTNPPDPKDPNDDSGGGTKPDDKDKDKDKDNKDNNDKKGRQIRFDTDCRGSGAIDSKATSQANHNQLTRAVHEPAWNDRPISFDMLENSMATARDGVEHSAGLYAATADDPPFLGNHRDGRGSTVIVTGGTLLIGSVHGHSPSHPDSLKTDTPPSALDVMTTAWASRDSPNYGTSFVYVYKNDGQRDIYSITVTDRAKAGSFAHNYSHMVDEGTHNFRKGEGIYRDWDNARKLFSEMNEDDRECAAMAHVLKEYDAGIVLTKQKSNGSDFKSFGTYTDSNGKTRASECP